MAEDVRALVESAKALPEIVDEGGKPVARRDVLQLVLQMAQTAQLARIRRSLEKDEFEGVEDPRTLSASDERKVLDLVMEHPYKPWITVSFFNDGPDTVYLCINRMRVNPVVLLIGESYSPTFAKGERRIELIYYWCSTGETALLRAVGKY